MNNRKGFTLVEMLAVVIIVGILTSVALPQYRRAVKRAKVTEALGVMRVIYDATELYAVQTGYKDYRAFVAAEGDVPFKRLANFDETSVPCTLSGTRMVCKNFTYALESGDVTATASEVKDGKTNSTEIRLHRADIPYLTCNGTAAMCDLYNITRETPSTGKSGFDESKYVGDGAATDKIVTDKKADKLP